MKKSVLVLFATMLTGLSAQAFVCIGKDSGGCTIRVYPTRGKANLVTMYASNCRRSDENGSEVFKRSDLKFHAKELAILHTVSEEIALKCKR